MLVFDEHGYLKPNDAILSNEEELEVTFVWNQHRRMLFEQYQAFVKEITQLSITHFFLWVNGSFVTKKENPNDIDLVVFLPQEQHDLFEKKLQFLKKQFPKIDAYFVSVFPENHPSFSIYQLNKAEWMFQFSFTRKNRQTNKRYIKGFLQLNF